MKWKLACLYHLSDTLIFFFRNYCLIVFPPSQAVFIMHMIIFQKCSAYSNLTWSSTTYCSSAPVKSFLSNTNGFGRQLRKGMLELIFVWSVWVKIGMTETLWGKKNREVGTCTRQQMIQAVILIYWLHCSDLLMQVRPDEKYTVFYDLFSHHFFCELQRGRGNSWHFGNLVW